MNAWLKRLATSFIVTLGFTTGKLPAQAPVVPTSPPADPSPSTPLAVLMARPEMPGGPGGGGCLNSRGYNCASDPNWFGCGNWRTQNAFVFGSCRSFFMEPCIPNPARPARQPRP